MSAKAVPETRPQPVLRPVVCALCPSFTIESPVREERRLEVFRHRKATGHSSYKPFFSTEAA